MNARTRRFVEMIRDDNDPNVVVRDMLTAVLQYVADLEEDDPGDNEPADAHRIARLRANVELALADV